MVYTLFPANFCFLDMIDNDQEKFHGKFNLQN